MYQHVLAGLHICAGHQHVPGREGYERQRGCFFPTQIRRFGKDVYTRNSNKLGVSTVAAVTNDVVLMTQIVSPAQTRIAVSTRNAGLNHHLIARLYPRNKFAYFANRPSDVIAEYVRQGNLNARQSIPYEDVEMVQRRGFDFNKNFIRANFWTGNINVFEYFRSTMISENGGFHVGDCRWLVEECNR